MTVFVNGTPEPGTTRIPASQKVVQRRREARHAWKTAGQVRPGTGEYCTIYGWRRAKRKQSN